MKATEAKLLSFLQKSPQFVIPIHQRTLEGISADVLAIQKEAERLLDGLLKGSR